MQRLLVLQSLWAMQLDATNGVEKTLEENVELIVEAGFDGISMSFEDEARARRAAALLAGTGLVFEAQLYPQTIHALQPGLDLCAAIGVHHVAVPICVHDGFQRPCRSSNNGAGWRRRQGFPSLSKPTAIS